MAEVEPGCWRTEAKLEGGKTEEEPEGKRSSTKLKEWRNKGQSEAQKSMVDVERQLTKA